MPDHNDDFDRRLGGRLRDYEAGFPARPAPNPVGTSGYRRPWPAIAAIAAGAVAAGTLLGAVLLSGPRFDVAQTSPTPTSPGSGQASTATPAPSATPTSPTPSPTDSGGTPSTPSASAGVPATPVATTSARAEGWSLAATFGDGADQPSFVFDATVWNDRFVALGVRLDDFASDCCVWKGQPMIWTSVDGIEWEARPLGIDLGDAPEVDDRVYDILALPDGRLMVTGSRYAPTAAWISGDGVTWSQIEILPAGSQLSNIAAGPDGFVLLANAPAALGEVGAEQLWHSGDGVNWQLTFEAEPGDDVHLETVAAGPEGFVVVGGSGTDAERPYVLASSDGRSWLLAPVDQPAFHDGDFAFDVAPLGGDWVATGFGSEQADQRAVVWRSRNGLQWTRDLGPLDPAGRDSYYATDIAGDAGVVVLSPNVSAISGPFPFPTYAWTSTDGDTWSTIEPDQSYVTDVVSIGSTTIAVGNIGRGERAAFWVLQR